MDMNALIESSSQFLTTDIGATIFHFFQSIYTLLFPANAEAAHDIPLPVPNLPIR